MDGEAERVMRNISIHIIFIKDMPMSCDIIDLDEHVDEVNIFNSTCYEYIHNTS